MKIKVICQNPDLRYALEAYLSAKNHRIAEKPDLYLLDCALLDSPAETEVTGQENCCFVFSAYGDVGSHYAAERGYKGYIMIPEELSVLAFLK